MIDIPSFLSERERLRRFCFQRTKATIVVRDVTGSLAAGEKDPATRLAEWVQFLLKVDATRFADPDDDCEDEPSLFAFPTSLDTRGDVEAVVAAHRAQSHIVIDYRPSEAALPLFGAATLAEGKMKIIKAWDRAMRRRNSICSVVSRDAAVQGLAIQYDGSRVLRRIGGETYDLDGPYWFKVYGEVSMQRCMKRVAWRRAGFLTEGSA